MSLGKRVKEYRVNNNIDQKEFAEKIDVTQPYLSHLESGKVEASERLKNRILKIIESETQENIKNTETDNVKSPKHYLLGDLGIEVKDVIFEVTKDMKGKEAVCVGNKGVIFMKKIRVTHKDGDMQGITLIYLVNKYLKINRELWDQKNMILNRYYKAILTRTIKVSDKIVDRFKSQINYHVEKDVIKILDEAFTACEHKETGDSLELLRTMFFVIMMLGTINSHKRNMIGVVLKSMITDVVKAFEDFKTMWLREIDDNVIRLEEAGAC